MTASKTPQFLFDFGSPNAYLSHRVIPAIEARSGVRFEYVPVLLGGLFKLANNRSPVEAYAEVPKKLAYERREFERFVAKHGLSAYRDNPHFPVNTLKMMRIATAAKTTGVLAPCVEAFYVAMWEQGRNMDDFEAIGEVLTAAGLDAADLIAKSQEPDNKARLASVTQDAFDRGAFGSPTFFVGDEMFFGKERLDAVEAEALGR